MNLIKKIEHKTGKEIKELYHEFMDLPRNLRLAIDVALVLALFFAIVAITPDLKYSLLNFFGTPQTQIKVVDAQEGLPIMDAQVIIDDDSFTTNDDGIINTSELKFGQRTVEITKPGFKTIKTDLMIKEKNSSFEQALEIDGKKVIIEAKQYLSDQKIDKFTVKSDSAGGITASGRDGRALLAIPGSTTLEISAEVTATGFNSQVFSVDTAKDDTTNSLAIVPFGEHYFLASRGGATTIYTSDLSGGNQQRLIEPAGFEGSDSSLYTAPNGERAVYEASRRGDIAGRQLYLVNLKTKEIKEFDSGFNDWNVLSVNDQRVIYIADSGNPADKKNQRLIKYDFVSGEKSELIASPQMLFPSATGGEIVFAEMIERGSYPGGYLLRQLIAINEDTGDLKKLSQDATITGVKVVAPTQIQYSQINPQTGAEVRFIYDTDSRQSFQAPADKSAKNIQASLFEQNTYGWTTDSARTEFGNSDMEKTLSYTTPANLIIKRWLSKDYVLLDTADGQAGASGLILRVDSGKTGPLP